MDTGSPTCRCSHRTLEESYARSPGSCVPSCIGGSFWIYVIYTQEELMVENSLNDLMTLPDADSSSSGDDENGGEDDEENEEGE